VDGGGGGVGGGGDGERGIEGSRDQGSSLVPTCMPCDYLI